MKNTRSGDKLCRNGVPKSEGRGGVPHGQRLERIEKIMTGLAVVFMLITLMLTKLAAAMSAWTEA